MRSPSSSTPVRRFRGLSGPPGTPAVRHGTFELIDQIHTVDGRCAVALIHGAVAVRDCPLVHVQARCELADAPASGSCRCRGELDAAVGRMLREGAGVLLQVWPEATAAPPCGGDRPVDATSAAALLRGAGVRGLRLVPHADRLADELRAHGLDVAEPEPEA